jgi:type I restriction enzyme S subunit
VRLLSPPSPEQRAIAAFLDRETARIDALIEKKQRQIELLQEKRTALIHQAIHHPGTKDLRLRHVANHVLRPIDRKDEEVYTAVGLYNWARGIFHKEPKAGFDLGDSEFFWLKSDDLILSGQFAWEGAVALANEEEEGCVVSHRYPVLRGKPDLMDTAYLWAFFTTKRGHFFLDDHSRGAAGRNRPLNINTLSKEVIPVPPLIEQRKVAEHVYFERRFKKVIASSIDLLQKYRAALISAVVTGKIDVRKEVA